MKKEHLELKNTLKCFWIDQKWRNIWEAFFYFCHIFFIRVKNHLNLKTGLRALERGQCILTVNGKSGVIAVTYKLLFYSILKGSYENCTYLFIL